MESVRKFDYISNRFNVLQSVTYDVKVPLAEFLTGTDLYGHLFVKQNVQIPFRSDVCKAFSNFVIEESQICSDSEADKAVDNFLNISDEDRLKNISEILALFDKVGTSSKYNLDLCSPKNNLTKQNSRELTFDELFQFVMKNSNAIQFSQIIKAEADMSEKMRTLVRARDFEMERLSKACETAMNMDSASIESDIISHQSYNLAILNEKYRQVNKNYSNQIEALCQQQRQSHRELINRLHKNEDIQLPKVSNLRRLQQHHQTIGIKKSFSCDSQIPFGSNSRLIEQNRGISSREESFTIYIGAQLKTTHNARILLIDRLSDLCQNSSSISHNESLHNDYIFSELFESQRLQLLMSLYGRELTSVVLLVGRDPMFHINKRSKFARICEQSSELHFDSLDTQLRQMENELCKAKKHRRTSLSYDSVSKTDINGHNCKDSTNMEAKDDNNLRPGDVYVTCHSNLSSVQVVFHLVTDAALQNDDISSRHPCIGALRNIIRLASRCSIRNIYLPLLLVESMNEARFYLFLV